MMSRSTLSNKWFLIKWSQRLSLGVIVYLLLTACSAPKRTTAPAGIKDTPPPPPLHRLLPLKDSTVSNFATQSDLGEKGRLVLEIYRPRSELAELKIAGRVQRLAIEENRISSTSGGILLELPLEEGHTFRGAFGVVVIAKTNLKVIVPAGEFEGCLLTVEESTLPPKRAESTYCPDVGLVKMAVETFGGEGAQLLETRLIYHGPRVEFQ